MAEDSRKSNCGGSTLRRRWVTVLSEILIISPEALALGLIQRAS